MKTLPSECTDSLIARAARLAREHELHLVGCYADALASHARGGTAIAAAQQR